MTAGNSLPRKGKSEAIFLPACYKPLVSWEPHMSDFRDHIVTSIEALERIYGEPYGPSIAKETDRITTHYRAFIEPAPFFALAPPGRAVLGAGHDGARRPRLFPARRRAGLRAHPRREDAARSRPARQQPHRQPAQYPCGPAGGAALPHSGLRRDHSHQRPRRNLHRSGAV